ncbi:unnamed protein product [Adineta ricciae]|uniref:Uncharacterized protein n=1 Tax=Adineta ricciae TaxID=249248 RepID=A0A813QDF2_ADIRI|nr:unnamed protein product [Adineta ricciae]
MRATNCFLLLCAFVGIVASFSPRDVKWPPWQSSVFTDPLGLITKKICSYCVEHPDRAETSLDKMTEALQKTDETTRIFAGTLAYINQIDNREKLTNNTSTCATFLNEINDALMDDLKTNLRNSEDATNKAIETWKSFFDIFKNLLQ